jgi:hypothetical protein
LLSFLLRGTILRDFFYNIQIFAFLRLDNRLLVSGRQETLVVDLLDIFPVRMNNEFSAIRRRACVGLKFLKL